MELQEELQKFRRENREEHKKIMKRQDETNGRVNKIENWKAQMQGAWKAIKAVGTGTSVLIGLSSGAFGSIVAWLLFQYVGS